MAVIGPFDFRGGYSPGYGFITLPQDKGYATTMENCRFKAGCIVPRWTQSQTQTGLSGIAGNNAACYSIKSWTDAANSVTALVATADSKLWIADATSYLPSSSTMTFTNRTGTASTATLGDHQVAYDSLNSILIGAGVSGAPFKVTAYNANAAALGGSPPTGACVKQCNNFLFIAGLTAGATQSNVYWSNVNDPETWTAANVLAFNKNDGEPIMALGAIGTDLYIFKQNSIGRLSTVTITTSGAVTLGPLVTVVRGVGCCGPRALDNLPNGNIVFMGYDRHFYEFDGSTVLDRSRQPLPGINAYDNGAAVTSHSNIGIGACAATANTNVKVVRGINEVWISFDLSLYNNNPLCFMYDFEQNIWQGNSTVSNSATTAATIAPYCFTTLNIDNISNVAAESSDFIVHGTASGYIFAQGNYLQQYPMNDVLGSSAVNFSVGTTIHLMGAEGPIIPRSICFETTNTTSSLNALVLYANFDTYTASTSVYSSSGAQPVRVVVPLSFKQNSVGTNIFPATISLLWTASGSGASAAEIFRLGRFWISDEVIR